MAFPDTPLANEFVKKEEANKPQDVFPLRLVMCRGCLHVQIGDIVDPQRLFGRYVYVTGTSPLTIEHLRNQASEVLRRHTSAHDRGKLFVVEIGSNDGSLLKEFQKLGVGRVLGVDPAADIVAKANAEGVPTIRDFFSSETAEAIVSDYRRADIVVANNVFAHVPDIRSVAEATKKLMTPKGLLVFEVAHLLDVVDHFAFDTIYHEHFSYHTILPLIRMWNEVGMKVVAVERQSEQVGRGSLRVWVSNEEPSSTYLSTSIVKLVDVEKKVGLYERACYQFVSDKIAYRSTAMKQHLNLHMVRGPVVGFGAPAKLTTLMYAYGINGDYCQKIFDDSAWKSGLFTPGRHIPVLTSESFEKQIQEDRPSAMVIYAWNFASDIIKRYAPLASKYDFKLVVPLPTYSEIQSGQGKALS